MPKPIAAKIKRSGFTYQADILIEKINEAKDLVAILSTRALETDVLVKIGQEIRKMHDAQVNHTDLNIHNVLIDADNSVWIIDFDKCAIQAGDSWKKSNLDRLLRSFKKEVQKGTIKETHFEFEQILKGYQ